MLIFSRSHHSRVMIVSTAHALHARSHLLYYILYGCRRFVMNIYEYNGTNKVAIRGVIESDVGCADRGGQWTEAKYMDDAYGHT